MASFKNGLLENGIPIIGFLTIEKKNEIGTKMPFSLKK